jgi:tetratricopeptide (TPR) repeat protein
MRIGVHTGPVVTGEVGHGERTDQLALGSAPNIAARVQALAAPGEMLLTQATHALVAKRLDCTPIGDHELKGVAHPITLYRASRVRDPETIDALALQATPFVGRDRELQQLMNLLELSSRGEGQTVLLTGDAGIGKTRLQLEARRRLEGRIDQWYTCRCSALHENSGLYPILGLFARLLGDGADQAALYRWLDELGLDSEEYRTVLSVLLNVGEATPRAGVRAVDASQRSIRVVCEVLRQLSNTGPIVIAFEDVHWADPSTLEVLSLLGGYIASYRALIVISARTGFVPPWEPSVNQTQLELDRLPTSTSTEMVRSLVAGKLPASVVKIIVERTDGVPLFLEELTQTLLGRDLASHDFNLLIPATLRDSLMARLDRLGAAKATAQLGALLGRRFGLDLLKQVSHLPVSLLEDQLSRIVDSGLLIRQGHGEGAAFIFKHALIQDTAYESLLIAQRRQLHNQVVQAVQRDAAIGARMQPELLARHLEGADRTMEAVAQYQVAGARALQRWALVEAIGLFRRGLTLLGGQPRTAARDQIEMKLLRALAEPLRAHKSYNDKEVVSVFERMLDLVRSMDRERQFPVLVNMWGVHCVSGHRENTEAAAQELMQLAQQGDSKVQMGSARFARGMTDFYRGHLQTAIDHLTTAIQLLDGDARFGDRASDLVQDSFLARLVKAWALTLAGRPDTARKLLGEVLLICEKHNSPFKLAHTLCHLNMVDQELESDPQQVLERALWILRIAEAHSMPTWVQFAHMHAGWARAIGGDAEGIVELRRAIDTLYVEDETSKGHTLLTLAQSLQAHDRDTESLAVIDEADQFFDRNLSVFAAADANRLRGLCAARAGDPRTARSLFQQSQRLARTQGNKLVELKALCDEATLIRESRDAERIISSLVALYQSIDEGRDTRPLVRAAALVDALRR